MSSLPGKSSQVSKIPKAFHYEVSRDRKEYFAINQPSSSKIQFSFAKSFKPLRVISEERIGKDRKVDQRGKIVTKIPIEKQPKQVKTQKSLLDQRKDIPAKRVQAKKISPREEIGRTLKVNEILEKTLQTVNRLKLSRISDTEKLNRFLKLINQIGNDIRKYYPEIRQPPVPQRKSGEDRIVIATDRLRSPRQANFRDLIENQLSSRNLQDESMPGLSSFERSGSRRSQKFSQLGSLGSAELKDESMPEYSSFGISSQNIEASGRDKSILASHEMDTQDLFEGGIVDPSQLNISRRPGFIAIDEQFSDLHEESSPELVSAEHGGASSLSQTFISDLEKESFPEMHSGKSFAGVSTGHGSTFHGQEIQDESMPAYKSSSFLDSHQDKSGRGSSILKSHEMNTDDLFSAGIDYIPDIPSDKMQEIAGRIMSQLDEESSPFLVSESQDDLHDESLPDYSSFELSLSNEDSGELSILASHEMDTEDFFDAKSKTSSVRRTFDEIAEGLSEIDEESPPELVSASNEESTGSSSRLKSSLKNLSDLREVSFPGMSSSGEDSSDWEGSFLKSHEMDTKDLFEDGVTDADQFNAQKRYTIEIDDQQSDLDEESSPELVGASHERVSEYLFESQGNLQEESMPDYPSYVSSMFSQSGQNGSVLKSHEMNTEDLFEGGILDPNQLNVSQRQKSSIYERISEIDEESSPELVSNDLLGESGLQGESMPQYTTLSSFGELNDESFPQVSSTFDNSVNVSKRESIRNLINEILSPRRGSRRVQEPNLSSTSSKSVRELSRREEDSAKDVMVRCAIQIVRLKDQELERTKARYRRFFANVKNVLQSSRRENLPRESMKRMFDQLEQEVESFVGTPKKLPENF